MYECLNSCHNTDGNGSRPSIQTPNNILGNTPSKRRRRRRRWKRRRRRKSNKLTRYACLMFVAITILARLWLDAPMVGVHTNTMGWCQTTIWYAQYHTHIHFVSLFSFLHFSFFVCFFIFQQKKC